MRKISRILTKSIISVSTILVCLDNGAMVEPFHNALILTFYHKLENNALVERIDRAFVFDYNKED